MAKFTECVGCPKERPWGCRDGHKPTFCGLTDPFLRRRYAYEERVFAFLGAWGEPQIGTVVALLEAFPGLDGPIPYEAVWEWDSEAKRGRWWLREMGYKAMPSIPPYCEERMR